MKSKSKFAIILFIGLIVALVPLIGKIPFAINGSSGNFSFQITGIDATIFVIGFLIIIAAFLFKYKKLPRFG